MKLATGYNHTLLLRDDGTVWSWGDNSFGQLGDGSVTPRQNRIKIASLPQIMDICAAGNSSFAISIDGRVWAWGQNNNGQLGSNSTTNLTVPNQVANLVEIVSLSASTTHCAALRKDGTAYFWGSNAYGAFGNNTSTNSLLPVASPGFSNCTMLIAGSYYTIGLTADGTLCSSGYNNMGQLGDGSSLQKRVPVAVANLTDVIYISAGENSSFAIINDGTLYAWGQNNLGQLGLEDTTNQFLPTPVSFLERVKCVTSGTEHSFAILEDGSLYAWGYNRYSKLGNNTLTINTVYSAPVQITALAAVRSVGAGQEHSSALLEDGSLYAWGNNNKNQLADPFFTECGVPNPLDKYIRDPSLAPSLLISYTMRELTGRLNTKGGHSWFRVRSKTAAQYRCSIISDAPSIQIEFYNSKLEMLPLAESESILLPLEKEVEYYFKVFTPPSEKSVDCTYSVRLERLEDEENIIPILSAGANHTLALLEDGTVWSWGNNQYGQLGNGTTTEQYEMQQVLGLTEIVDICAAESSSYALKKDGTVWAWGNNSSGQLGIGSYVNQVIPVRVANLSSISRISSSGTHSLALGQDGSLWAWGINGSGQIGNGSTVSTSFPEQVKNLPRIADIFAGKNFSLTLATNGQIWAWGANTYDVYGANISANTEPTPIPCGTFSQLLAASDYQVMARKDNGQVYVWGLNTSGQLGIGTTTTPAEPVLFEGADDFTRIVMGPTHTFGIKNDGSVWAWGSNTSGKLGDGLSAGAVASVPTEMPSLKNMIVLAPGNIHSAALHQNHALYVWGSNTANALANRELTQSALPIGLEKGGHSSSQATSLYLGTHVRRLNGIFSSAHRENWYKIQTDLTTEYTITLSCSDQQMNMHVLDQSMNPVVPCSPSTFCFERGNTFFINVYAEPTSYFSLKSYTLSFEDTSAKRHSRPQLSSTANHTLSLMEDGTVWAWGYNGLGQLGLGDYIQPDEPKQITTLSNVSMVCATENNSFALKEDGTVWAWGHNSYGQLGTGDTNTYNVPIQIDELEEIVQISSSSYHCLALQRNGTVWAWGQNNNGQVGNGNTSNMLKPYQISTLPEIAQVFAGNGCSLALSTYGDIWVWGSNANGVYGGVINASRLPVQVASLYGYSQFVAAHNYQIYARKDNGQIFTWGLNTSGQLGLGNFTTQTQPVRFNALEDIQSIALGATSSFAILEDGTLYAWGNNYSGKLGDDTLETTISINQPRKIEVAGLVLDVAAGANHTVVLRKNGTFWMWGNNAYGQLANIQVNQSLLPVPLELCANTPEEANQITLANRMREIKAHINTQGEAHWYRIESFDGGSYTFSVANVDLPLEFELHDSELNRINFDQDGGVDLAKGHSYYLKIWYGGRRLVSISPYSVVITEADSISTIHPQLSAGYNHTLALLEDGAVWAWGDNSVGQLGSGGVEQPHRRIPVSDISDAQMICAADNSSYVLKQDGTVWAWGSNNQGQLGCANTTNQSAPIQVENLHDVIQISASGNHTLALKRDGSVWAWGSNNKGQIGINTTTAFYQTPVLVNNLPKVMQVLALGSTSIALAADGYIWAWGENINGVYGASVGTYRVPTKISSSFGFCRIASGNSNQVMAWKDDKTIYTWGLNTTGQLGIGNTTNQLVPVPFTTLTGVQKIEMGTTSTFAILKDGSIYAWGSNANGKLGIESAALNSNVSLPQQILGLDNVLAVASGTNHTTALLKDGSLWAWGSNAQYQMGKRLQNNSNVPICIDETNNSAAQASPVHVAHFSRKVNGILNHKQNENWTQVCTHQNMSFNISLACDNPMVKLNLLNEELEPLPFGEDGTVSLYKDETYYFVVYSANELFDAEEIPLAHSQYTIVFQSEWSKWLSLPMLSVGNAHTLALMEDGVLWGWGDNQYGQIGNPAAYRTYMPTQVMTDVVYICSAADTSYAIKSDGTLWSWGLNTNGQAGVNSTTNISLPTQVSDLSNIIQISASGTHAIALREDGTIYTWGLNSSFQLGNNTNTHAAKPVSISSIKDVIQVFAGTNCSLALTANGDIWSWGSNTNGICGVESATNRVPTISPSLFGYSLFEAAHASQIIARKDDGLLYTWGQNTQGQLGIGTTVNLATPQHIAALNNTTLIVMGPTASYALNEDGSLLSWGCNTNGCLGDISLTEGQIVTLPTPTSTIDSILTLSAGPDFVVVIKADGSLWSWGNNSKGQLAYKLDTQSLEPTLLEYNGISAENPSDIVIDTTFRDLEGFLTKRSPENWFHIAVLQDNSYALSLDCDNPEVIAELYRETFDIIDLSENPIIEMQKSKSYYIRVYGPEQSDIFLSRFAVRLEQRREQQTAQPMISSGSSHTLSLLADGTVWAWGSNQYNQLGDSTSVNKHQPTQLQSLSGIVAVCAAAESSYALREDGVVLAWGRNNYYQLGVSATANQSKPVQIGLNNIIQISSSGTHSAALQEDGTVWTWGLNSQGQIGNNSTTNQPIPVKVTGLPKITQIFACYLCTLALSASGDLWAWGNNTLYGCNIPASKVPIFIPGMSGYSRLHAAMAQQAIAQRDNRKFYAWGVNNKGQLGIGTLTNQIEPALFSAPKGTASIALGSDNGFAITEDGALYGWGANSSGKLGIENLASTDVLDSPTRIPTVHSLEAISPGQEFTIAMKKDQSLWSWGDNTHEQLGNSDVQNSNLPIPMNKAGKTPADATDILIGNPLRQIAGIMDREWDTHWYCLRTLRSGNFHLYMEDENTPIHIQLIGDGEAPLRPAADGTVGLIKDKSYYLKVSCETSKMLCAVPYTITLEGTFREWKNTPQLSAGSNHGLVLMEDGTVWSWGNNQNGQLGDGTTISRAEQTQVPNLYGVVMVCATHQSSYALKSDGTVWSWGYNNQGQLGIGNTTQQMSPVQIPAFGEIVQLSASSNHVLALQADGTVWGFGSNGNYQLGTSSVSTSTRPVVIDGLPKIMQIVACSNCSLALAANGDIWAWGANSSYIYGSAATMSRIPLRIDSLKGFSRILAAHSLQIMAQKDDGRLVVWGYNQYGQLGLGHTINPVLPVEFNGLTNMKSIVFSSSHALAVLEDNSLWTWGYNSTYKLGLGDTTALNAIVSTPVQIDSMDAVLVAAAGETFSMALRQDGSLWTWGNNTANELGVSTPAQSAIPVCTNLEVYLANKNIESPYTAPVRELEAGGHLLFTGTICSADGVDWFALRPKQRSRYALDISCASDGLGVTLYNARMEEQFPVDSNLYLLKEESVYLIKVNHEVVVQFPRTEYAVLFTHVEDDYVCKEHPKGFKDAKLVALPVDAVTDFTGVIHSAGDINWYLIKSQANSDCTIALECDDSRVHIQVFDEDLQPVIYNDNQLTLDHNTRYYLKVSYMPYCENIHFSISLDNQAYEPGDLPNEPMYTQCSMLPVDEVSTFDGTLHDCGDTDWYQFACEEKATINIELASDNPEVGFTLHNQYLQPIDSDGTSLPMEGNTQWFVKVDGNSQDEFAPYTLSVHPRCGVLMIQAGKTCYVSINGTSIRSLEPQTLQYNPEHLKLIDFAAHALGLHTAPGEIPGTDLEILSVEDGEVQFVWYKEIPQGQVYDGPVTLVEFEALVDGETQLKIVEE